MHKIILRKKTLFPGQISCGITELTNGNSSSLKQYPIDKHFMKVLFDEDLENDDLLQTNLYRDYLSFQSLEDKTGENFIKAYRIAQDFALHIDSNIYLYHIMQNQSYARFVPWVYADGKKYIGDPWWETDEEILNNVQHMNIVDFLRLYKGY